MAKEQKYYVVWKGNQPGIYDNWDDCKKQVHGFPKAIYRSFKTKDAAETAFHKGIKGYYETKKNPGSYKNKKSFRDKPEKNNIHPPILESIVVDAACGGNPGPMEYQGIFLETNEYLFKVGPYLDGTNNIGEFLAIVHALGYCKNKNLTIPIYSDSRNAILWVKAKKANTKLAHTGKNDKIFDLIVRAEQWLQQNSYPNKILKWETKAWGENPADFGRK
ncbi:MAG: ribonuclease H family protein [Sphingobacteriales bacterium]|nr:ribonuclease H family protein [Sphingobacteriales bacterium]